MKFKRSIIIILSAILITGVGFSCQNKDKEDISEKAEAQIEKLGEKIENLSTDDPDFNEKLTESIQEFNDAMDELADSMEESGEDLNNEVQKRIREIKGKSLSLEDKIKMKLDAANDEAEDISEEINEEFNDLKESLDSDN